ncbi:MAG: MOSC domain-containing protein, partial [Nitrososphaerales archaeon]
MRVLQINVSPSGGLPKLPVEKVFVKKTGLEGDYNKYRMTKLNGDPTSAVLLLPHVTILSYAKRGYKVGPGSMGENFTLESVSYEELRIGRKLALGREV